MCENHLEKCYKELLEKTFKNVGNVKTVRLSDLLDDTYEVHSMLNKDDHLDAVGLSFRPIFNCHDKVHLANEVLEGQLAAYEDIIQDLKKEIMELKVENNVLRRRVERVITILNGESI